MDAKMKRKSQRLDWLRDDLLTAPRIYNKRLMLSVHERRTTKYQIISWSELYDRKGKVVPVHSAIRWFPIHTFTSFRGHWKDPNRARGFRFSILATSGTSAYYWLLTTDWREEKEKNTRASKGIAESGGLRAKGWRLRAEDCNDYKWCGIR